MYESISPKTTNAVLACHSKCWAANGILLIIEYNKTAGGYESIALLMGCPGWELNQNK
jgi:hypothetical protein